MEHYMIITAGIDCNLGEGEELATDGKNMFVVAPGHEMSIRLPSMGALSLDEIAQRNALPFETGYTGRKYIEVVPETIEKIDAAQIQFYELLRPYESAPSRLDS